MAQGSSGIFQVELLKPQKADCSRNADGPVATGTLVHVRRGFRTRRGEFGVEPDSDGTQLDIGNDLLAELGLLLRVGQRLAGWDDGRG